MKKTFQFKTAIIYSLLGLIVNVLLFSLFLLVGFYPSNYYVEQAQGPITLLHISISTIVPAIIGTCLGLLFYKFVPKGKTVFIILSVLFTLLSFYGPLGIPGVTIGMVMALNFLHLTTALFITVGVVKAMQ